MTFSSNAAASAVKAKLAAYLGISPDDIAAEVATDASGNQTVTFRFTSANAGALSDRFLDLNATSLATEFGVIGVRAAPSTSAPAAGGAVEDPMMRLVLYIAIPIGSVVILVVLGFVIRGVMRSSGEEAAGRVGFNDYMEMADKHSQNRA